MILKSLLIICIIAMSGVIIPGVFAANDNVTIEGNLNPLNRSEELYVVKFDAVSKMTEVTFSIYSIDDYCISTFLSYRILLIIDIEICIHYCNSCSCDDWSYDSKCICSKR